MPDEIAKIRIIYFLVFIQNLLKSGGLEPVLSYTTKLCLASYYIQFSTNKKTGINLITLHFISEESCLYNNARHYQCFSDLCV